MKKISSRSLPKPPVYFSSLDLNFLVILFYILLKKMLRIYVVVGFSVEILGTGRYNMPNVLLYCILRMM